jgi:hypothetical protein
MKPGIITQRTRKVLNPLVMFLFALFAFFAAHFSFFMAYQKHWSPAFTGVREDNICVHLRSSVDMPYRAIHGCPDLAIQIRIVT